MINYYKREEGLACNEQPVYKMFQNSFYIYKSKDSNYWCDSYLPENIVNCDVACAEVRFSLTNNQFVDLNSSVVNKATPEGYDFRFRMWEKKPNDFISCADNNSVASSTLMTTTSKLFVNTVKVNIAEKMKLLPSFKEKPKMKAQNHKLLTSVGDLGDRMEQIERFILNRKEKNSLAFGAEIASSNNTATTTTTTTTTTKSTTTATTTTKSNGFNVQFLIRKQFDKNFKSKLCPLIEHQVLEDSKLAFKQSIPISFGLNCKGYPVYKSSNGVYLYRNLFGDWCHEKLNHFLPEVRCMQQCMQNRLLPTGISSPFESTSVEVFQKQEDSKIVTNQRYMCTGNFDCSDIGCLNGGICLSQISAVTGLAEYKCQCLPQFTGLICDIILDACYSNPCLNNGICNAKPYDEPRCNCTNGYSGKYCEIFHNPCLLSNPCLNGGTCFPQAANTNLFYCQCTPAHQGRLCEYEALTACMGQNEGTLFPHPTNKSSFLLCSRNGGYTLQACPSGLVYNSYLKRCDYNTDEPDLLNPCQHIPCKNGAKCTNKDNGFICTCNFGFTGELCETNIDECANANCGENSSCIDLINGYVCICANNFYGSDCRMNSKRTLT